MDITTWIGIIIGLTALVGGYLLEGGHINGLLVGTAALIVFGGTIGAVIVSFPKKQLRQLPKALSIAFREKQRDPDKIIQEIVDMATTARRAGVLSLESRAMEHEDPFLRKGLTMIVDGTDPELTKQILELDMDAVEKNYSNLAKIFESAGGYAPTMGIIGTVMGLVHVLSNLADPASLAGSIATAFTATLYGVASANIIYLPIAAKIKQRSEEQTIEMEMMLEGILALQAGENPQLIRMKLTSFLPGELTGPAKQEKGTDDGEAA
ncbi:flagellar motor protein [Paenibacillus sp. y28]|uniref:flagellar motor protein n=1 Tax=Paenibacillus sp. y28 TaxID=3129110 RepID=UPI00301A0A61